MYTNKILCHCCAMLFKTAKGQSIFKMIGLQMLQVFKSAQPEITIQSIVIKDNAVSKFSRP